MTGSDEPRLKVLSLNCWGLWIVANKRRERIQAIAEWISNSSGSSRNSYHSDSSDLPNESEVGGGYDVIALQEIWVRNDFDLIAERAKRAGLIYSKFFYSGAIGSGLAFLSRHFLESSFITAYPLNGFPLHFIQGDFFAGKSTCGISIRVPGIDRLVDVLNTHMYAPGGEGDQLDGAHRIAQAWELAKLVNEKTERGRHVICTGDFNSQPHSIIIQLIQSLSQLSDSWLETHPAPPSIASTQHRSLSPLQVMHTHGITCDSPLNTYSAKKLKHKSPSDDVIIRGGKRLDYIFYRSPPASSNHLKAVSTELRLTETVPNLSPPTSYSDHFALETIFTLSSTPQSSPSHLNASELLLRALSTLSSAYRQNSLRSRHHLQLFFLSLLLVPILSISASFEPLKLLNWIWVLLGVVNGVAGSTMLYVGFIAGNWERGGLRNVVGEIEDEVERRRKRQEEGNW
ncbi:inositol phosphosphingolipid phospholipase [Sporobolomyces salmoneus]|uniref:inositol phosphosphingolipid phospholipase n=1 Tax=Sporobolomyces salmoneus TaxID=183962 RepID=UPI003176FB41